MPRTAPTPEPVPRIALTLDEAALAAGVSERTIRRAIATRDLPAGRLTRGRRCTRVRVADLAAWIERHTSRACRAAREG